MFISDKNTYGDNLFIEIISIINKYENTNCFDIVQIINELKTVPHTCKYIKEQYDISNKLYNIQDLRFKSKLSILSVCNLAKALLLGYQRLFTENKDTKGPPTGDTASLSEVIDLEAESGDSQVFCKAKDLQSPRRKDIAKQIIKKVKECFDKEFLIIIENEMKIMKLYCDIHIILSNIISNIDSSGGSGQSRMGRDPPSRIINHETNQSNSLYNQLKNKIINYFYTSDPTIINPYVIYKNTTDKIINITNYYSIYILFITDHYNYIKKMNDKKIFKDINTEEYQNSINICITTCNTLISKYSK